MGGADQAVGQGEVAGDVAVGAGGERPARRGDFVTDREVLRGLAEVPARAEGGDVRLRDLGAPCELGPQEAFGALGRPVVQPGQQAEREHVLRPLRLLAGQREAGQRAHRQRGQRHRVHRERGERVVVQRRTVVPGLGQVAGRELVGVDDDLGAARQVARVRLQGGRVHRHQHVRRVPRGEDVVVGEVHLERGDSGQGACGGTDLRREVRQRRQVVAERRGLGGEPVPGQLHPVARVAREADDHAVEGPGRLVVPGVFGVLFPRRRGGFRGDGHDVPSRSLSPNRVRK
ncbi:hypothetical protein STEPF1_06370 [Streptomyces sp. F-1]|nr:hypothetical protein STEPF1_06370 [Streptomyces sp. F-1]